MLREVCREGSHDWYFRYPKNMVAPSRMTVIQKLRRNDHGHPLMPERAGGLSTRWSDVFCVRCQKPYVRVQQQATGERLIKDLSALGGHLDALLNIIREAKRRGG